VSAQFLDGQQIEPSNDIYDRLRSVERAVSDEVLGVINENGPVVTYSMLGGDSRGYGFTLHLADEKALEVASNSGLLEKMTSVAYGILTRHLELASEARIHFCFNSDEYVRARGDGFYRWHDGDWREDYVFVLNSKGSQISA
jgi:hypothetical protein